MSPCKAYFQPDNRYYVIVEEAPDMATAEQEADRFLQEVTATDEGGAIFQRILVSGIKQDEKYCFEVVVG